MTETITTEIDNLDTAIDRAMQAVSYGATMVEGYTIMNIEEIDTDEHDIQRSVVIEDVATGKFYKFHFRYNYRMADYELQDYIPVHEVFPYEVTVTAYK